jgi:hypothetical protein
MKTTTGKVDAHEIKGWTLGYEKTGQMEHISGCSRETAVSIALKNDADWCRPFTIRGGYRVVNSAN